MANYTKHGKLWIDTSTKPAKASGLYNNPYGYNHYGDFRYRTGYTLQDTERSVDATSRRQQVELSRQMFSQMGILDFGMELICEWAIGSHYDLIYTGADKQFRDSFEDYANNTWANNCNVLGPTYNLVNTLKNIIRELLRDGDLLQLYTFNRQGLPQLQYVKSHRIFQRGFTTTISGGRYDGYAVEDGVVKSGNGLPIGYYIQDPVKESDDYIVSTRDSILIYKPKFCDKTRGIPPIAPALLDALSVQELDDAIQRRLKLEALVALKIHNATGTAPIGGGNISWNSEEDTAPIVPRALPPIGIQTMVGGVKYIENESDITTLSSQSPNIEATNYIAGLETHLLSVIGVPHQLIFSPTDISRAPARGISEIFKKTISGTQALVEQFIYPAIVWAVGNAINDGFIAPPANNEKWYNNIDFTRPREFTLDAYNEAKQAMEFFKLGLTTRDVITTAQGNRGSQVVNRRKQEAIEVWSAAIEAKEELQTQFKGNPEVDALTITTIHNGIELMNPNGLTEPPQPIENISLSGNAGN